MVHSNPLLTMHWLRPSWKHCFFAIVKENFGYTFIV